MGGTGPLNWGWLTSTNLKQVAHALSLLASKAAEEANYRITELETLAVSNSVH